ncbi:MAG: hypothetical protein HOH33_17535 [Verrucomicrobia bacterium]|jgi:hypothetical protein|nr:hypothetical protein [Verrucomicrobiota bacterium]
MSKKKFGVCQRVRVIAAIVIMVTIAAIHAFRIGSYLDGYLYICYYSYASDLMLPFGSYFLLSMNELQFKFLHQWHVKALTVFSVMTFSEMLQFFGISFFGVTFDIVDILMYGIGAIFAALLDKQVFERLIPCWKINHVTR